MKLKPTLRLQDAERIVDVALTEGRKADLLPLTVIVLDAGGKIIATKSEDGSGIMRFDIAMGKAWGALGMGISSRLIRDRLELLLADQQPSSVAVDEDLFSMFVEILCDFPAKEESR